MTNLNRLNHLLCVVLLFSGTPAFAGEGVLEINQACALNGGCFAGDIAGFPVTINQGGSYVMTGNLAVSSSDTTVISITQNADGAHLDLNGFTISGVTSCTRVAMGGGDFDTSCTNIGAGVGIDVSAMEVTIRNGVIHGMGQNAIRNFTADKPGLRVDGLIARENGTNGISLSSNSVVSNCRAYRNGLVGIQQAGMATTLDNFAEENGTSGFSIGNGVIRGNVAKGNDLNGFSIGSHAVVTQNVAVDNDNAGLSLPVGTGYFGNTMNNNGTEVPFGINLGQNICGQAICP